MDKELIERLARVIGVCVFAIAFMILLAMAAMVAAGVEPQMPMADYHTDTILVGIAAIGGLWLNSWSFGVKE